MMQRFPRRRRSPGSSNACLGAALALLLAAPLAAPLAAAEPAAQGGAATALVHATVIDGTGAPARPGTTLVVEHGRITSLFADGQGKIPDGATVEDLAGKFVIPGLIDAHVHLTGAADDVDGYRALFGALLQDGVTTVRDMAGDDRLLAFLARDTASGALPGPDIFYAALLAGPSFLAEDFRAQAASAGLVLGEAPYMQAIDAGTDLPLAIAAARGTGATGIKLYANLPASLVAPLAAEAHRQGLLVWTHATIFPARPSDAVVAGADTLSHTPYLVWEAAPRVPWDYRQRALGDFAHVRPDDARILAVLDAMREHGTILDATVIAFVDEAQEAPEKVGAGIVDWTWAVTRIAHRARRADRRRQRQPGAAERGEWLRSDAPARSGARDAAARRPLRLHAARGAPRRHPGRGDDGRAGGRSRRAAGRDARRPGGARRRPDARPRQPPAGRLGDEARGDRAPAGACRGALSPRGNRGCARTALVAPSALLLRPSPAAVLDHPRLLEGDQPILDHLLEVGKELLDLRLGVDDFDDDRQILGEAQHRGGV